MRTHIKAARFSAAVVPRLREGLTIQAHDDSGYAKRKQQIRPPGSASPESDSPGIWRLRDRSWGTNSGCGWLRGPQVVRCLFARIESPAWRSGHHYAL
jgi:hypothetical protein